MKRIIAVLVVFGLIMLPGLAAAQAPAQTPEKAPAAAAAPQAAPAQPEAQPQAQAPPQCQMGPGGTCVMPGATPEQMKQMQGKMGQCSMMQPGQGCPKCQQVQKQLDDLEKRVEALEKAKGKKK
jgi:hypothetical protein